MTADEINAHLERFRDRQEKIANEEKARREREELQFQINSDACAEAIRNTVEPMLRDLAKILEGHGHESRVHPAQEGEQITERTKLKSKEYSTAIAVERPKGTLILRVGASPQSLQISATVGVPHGNCSSVFHAANGPLSQAVEVTERGIADFMASAFPLR